MLVEECIERQILCRLSEACITAVSCLASDVDISKRGGRLPLAEQRLSASAGRLQAGLDRPHPGPIPWSASSFIACALLGRSGRPMPRSTCGAFVNLMFS
jgi:hypothetical protein